MNIDTERFFQHVPDYVTVDITKIRPVRIICRWKTVFIFLYDSFLMNWSRIFIGMGKIIVELCSADIVLKVCRYRN